MTTLAEYYAYQFSAERLFGLQVVYSLIEMSDCKLEDIVEIMTEKMIARGGFSKGIILKNVN